MSNKDIFKSTLPVMFGYIPLSIAYAILGVVAGIGAKILMLFSFLFMLEMGSFCWLLCLVWGQI